MSLGTYEMCVAGEGHWQIGLMVILNKIAADAQSEVLLLGDCSAGSKWMGTLQL